MPLTAGIVHSLVASQKTLHRRTQQLEMAREVVSCGASVEQMEADVKGLSKELRQLILREAGLPVQIPPSYSLALKANLQLPWNKMCEVKNARTCTLLHVTLFVNHTSVFSAGLTEFSVSIASERKQRKLAKEILGTNLHA